MSSKFFLAAIAAAGVLAAYSATSNPVVVVLGALTAVAAYGAGVIDALDNLPGRRK